MKKICLLSIVLLIVCATNAQTEFSVPSPTMEQKYNLAKAFYYNTALTAINVAKSAGMTLEEYSKKCGKIFIWKEDMGFEQFVNNVLYQMTCLSDSVQIVNQSDEKIIFISSPIYTQLEKPGIKYGTSLEELVQWLDIIYGEIANYHNLNCNMKLAKEGLEVEITQ